MIRPPPTDDIRRIRPHQDDARGPCAAAIRDYRAAWERVRAPSSRPDAPAPVPDGRRVGSVVPRPNGTFQGQFRHLGKLVHVGTFATEVATQAAIDARAAQLRVAARPAPAAAAKRGRPFGYTGPTSRYRGVSRTRHGTFEAGLKFQGRYVLRRRFADEVEAARAYDRAARLHLGPAATLNFPEAR